MTDQTPRRRGRPPGSKNKPKPIEAAPIDTYPAEQMPPSEPWSHPRLGVAELRESWDPDGPPPPPATPAVPPGERIEVRPSAWDELPLLHPKVLIRRKASFGAKEEETNIEWPTDWPLPEVGDSITVRPGFGGFVAYRTFDLEGRRVIITLR